VSIAECLRLSAVGYERLAGDKLVQSRRESMEIRQDSTPKEFCCQLLDWRLRLPEILAKAKCMCSFGSRLMGNHIVDSQLENNKAAFALDFVSRSRFTAAYPTSLMPAAFVDALYANAAVTPSATDQWSPFLR